MNNNGLEVQVGRHLRDQNLSLALAESCTGGLISHRITNVAGSSQYFQGGVIAYANSAKVWLLGVRSETLDRYGSVSRETVIEMARGARNALDADIGGAVSGIAGPAGGTPEKPVGLVWIGLSAEGLESAYQFRFNGDRLQIKEQAADQTLLVLIDFIQAIEKGGRVKEQTLEAVEVTVRLDPQGRVIPVDFLWRDRRTPIESIGRRWSERTSEHLLVMDFQSQVYELVYFALNTRWYLADPKGILRES